MLNPTLQPLLLHVSLLRAALINLRRLSWAKLKGLGMFLWLARTSVCHNLLYICSRLASETDSEAKSRPLVHHCLHPLTMNGTEVTSVKYCLFAGRDCIPGSWWYSCSYILWYWCKYWRSDSEGRPQTGWSTHIYRKCFWLSVTVMIQHNLILMLQNVINFVKS